jgi:hypothetical protein
MSDVRKWLNTIDLAQYADAFETSDLDFDLLGACGRRYGLMLRSWGKPDAPG